MTCRAVGVEGRRWRGFRYASSASVGEGLGVSEGRSAELQREIKRVPRTSEERGVRTHVERNSAVPAAAGVPGVCRPFPDPPVRGRAWQGGPKRVGFAGAGLLEVAEPREGVPRGVKRVPLGETQGGVFISHRFPWEKSEGQWSEGEPLGARRP